MIFNFFKYIIFFYSFNFLFTYEINDTLYTENENYNHNTKANLIPNYNENVSFKNEYLGKTQRFFINYQLSYLNSLHTSIVFSPMYIYKKNRFKINIDYLFNTDTTTQIKNDWDNFMSLIEKIEFMNVSLFKDRLNFNIGQLRNISFGHGYLVSNYGNNFNYPTKRDVGFNANIKNKNNSIALNFFGSSIKDLSNNGGLIGAHLSVLISNSLPIKFGIGYISDLNQFISNENILSSLSKRQISGIEFDIEFPILDRIDLIGEFSTLKFPETRYYQRTDDSQFTNDKKSRDGSWGMLFPAIKYSKKNNKIQIGLNYNSSIHTPHFFNELYDFEKVRYREYDIMQNETLFSSESEILENYQTISDSLIILLPKDLYSMINGYENIYQTYGISLSSFYEFNSNTNLSLDYSNFIYLDESSQNSPFHSFSIKFNGKLSLFFFDSNFNLYLNKDFLNQKEFSNNEESTMFGANIEFLISKNFSIFYDLKNTFYDNNYDGIVDNNKLINIGVKLKY